jgi:predicted HicB family RNase H-like nuclease
LHFAVRSSCLADNEEAHDRCAPRTGLGARGAPYRVTWSAEDGEHLALCAEFPSLSWLAETPDAALQGIRRLVAEVVADMEAAGEAVPAPLADKHYSGQFRVRIPPEVHRALAIQAAEEGVSLNRLVSAKLASSRSSC